MNKTAFSLIIRNGSLFINENIQIDFPEAEITFPEAAKASYHLQSTEIVKPVKTIKPAKVITQPINKMKTTPKLGTEKTPLVRELIMQYLKSNGASPAQDIFKHVQKSFPEYPAGNIKNIFHLGKNNGTLVCPARAVYALGKQPHSTPLIIKKNSDQKNTKPNSERTGKSFVAAAALKKEDTILEELIIPVYQKYPSGENVIYGDSVKILSAADAKNEDDILQFDDEFAEIFAVVTECEEGSNMIKIKLNRLDREILVYPHWVKLVARA